jgi:hypothetical protein
VFTQKITNAERVLATVLYQRKLCTQNVLAELFEVSRRTIGDVIRELGPILTHNGHIPKPATQKFPTAVACSTPSGPANLPRHRHIDSLHVHRARNLLAEVSKNAQTEVKADYWAIFEVPEDVAPGLGAVSYVQKTYRLLRLSVA